MATGGQQRLLGAPQRAAAHRPLKRLDAGELELGAGLDALVSATLATLSSGDELEVRCASAATAYELPAWATLAGHETVAVEGTAVRLRRGSSRPPVTRGDAPDLSAGAFPTPLLRDLTGPPPERGGGTLGFVPLGARAEPGAPARHWRLDRRDAVWADEVAALTERATAAQWDATTDVPWESVAGVSPFREQATAQVATFLAQNEAAAFAVPARFASEVDPAFVELLLWLGSHVHDEARHLEVFTKRALAGGCRGTALASTQLSLATLLDEADFTAAALLLNVLGEGTFIDLLRFIADHAPDAAMRTAAELARRDELRHVHFGIAHVRRRIGIDTEQRRVLVAAAERRAAKLTSLDGLSPVVVESLTLMASESLRAPDVAVAGAAVRDLVRTMERNRVRRLHAAGFDEQTARELSALHTPNLM